MTYIRPRNHSSIANRNPTPIDYRTLCNNEDDWNHGLEDGGLNQSGIPCPPTDGLSTTQPTLFQVLIMSWWMETGL